MLKKDRDLKLYINYRGLNKISEKNRYPLPFISEIINRVSRSKFFIKINVKDIYYRI